jgi:DNA modification methylase
MTYYRKDGYVVDAKETITYTSRINKNLERPKEKNTIKTSMNDEYAHSTQSPLEGPKYIKKYVQNQNKKTAEHLINK